MRLCAPVYNYRSADEWVERHIKAGYGAALWPLGRDTADAEIDAYAKAAEDAGLVIAEVGAWCNLFDSDRDKREANIAYVTDQLALAERVGARCCVNISGSKSARWDGPHRDNLTEETYREVVETARRIIDAVNPRRTRFAFECMPFMYPHTAKSQAALLSDVGRDGFAVHADLCNLVNTIDYYYNTAPLCREFIGSFGDRIRSVHVKDIKLDEAATMKVIEVPLGEGFFDHRSLLVECAKLESDLPMVLEHLGSEAEYAAAAARLREYAGELGLEFVRL